MQEQEGTGLQHELMRDARPNVCPSRGMVMAGQVLMFKSGFFACKALVRLSNSSR
jgi:hypothetical protein